MSVFASFCNFSAFLSHLFRILKRENGNVGGRESFFILAKVINAEDPAFGRIHWSALWLDLLCFA